MVMKEKTTDKQKNWARKVLLAWSKEHNYGVNYLHWTIVSLITILVGCFKSVKQKNGKEYSPDTLYQLYNALYHVLLRDRQVDIWKDDQFDDCRKALDWNMQRLTALGIGDDKNKQEIFSNDEELKIQEYAFSFNNAWGLLRAIFYNIGKIFAFRGYEDHRFLSWNELKRYTDRSGIPYWGRKLTKSKTYNGGIKDRAKKVFSKLIRRMYGNSDDPHCPVRYLDEYFKHCPTGVDRVYLKPLETPQGDIWFSTTPLPDSLLRTMMENICECAGIPKRTNHILCAQCATTLFEAGYDVKVVMERTGHNSIKAAMAYNQTSDDMHRTQCAALAPKPVKRIHSSTPTPSTTISNNNNNNNNNITATTTTPSQTC
jgi:hypothetical protein